MKRKSKIFLFLLTFLIYKYIIIYKEMKEMKNNDKVLRTYKIEQKLYEEFRIYAIMINKSVSSLIEQFMRETLKKMKKEK